MLTPPPATPLQGDSSPTRLSQAHTRESVGQTVPAGLPAAHDPVSQCWRALREEDVDVDATPSSAPDPLVLEAADPVISHGVTQSRDRSMGRSTASHAGSLPMVPPSGRPPDCNDRPLGGATNDNACLAPSLLHLDRASAASTGPNLTVTPTSPPSAPAEAPTSAPTAAPTSAHTPTSAPTAPSPPRVSSEVGASQTWGVGPSRSQVLGSLAPTPIEAGSAVQKAKEAVRITPADSLHAVYAARSTAPLSTHNYHADEGEAVRITNEAVRITPAHSLQAVEAARSTAPLSTHNYYADLELPMTSGTFVDSPTFFTHYSAFAGIGTFALLFKLLGGECVGGCEIDEPTAQIFEKECPSADVG